MKTVQRDTEDSSEIPRCQTHWVLAVERLYLNQVMNFLIGVAVYSYYVMGKMPGVAGTGASSTWPTMLGGISAS